MEKLIRTFPGGAMLSLLVLMMLTICAMFTSMSGCSPSLVKAEENTLMTAIAATNGSGFAILQMRHELQMKCVADNSTRDKAEACVALVDAKFKVPLESLFYFRESMYAWQSAVQLTEHGKLSTSEVLVYAAECAKAYAALKKSAEPLGLKMPELWSM